MMMVDRRIVIVCNLCRLVLSFVASAAVIIDDDDDDGDSSPPLSFSSLTAGDGGESSPSGTAVAPIMADGIRRLLNREMAVVV